MNTLHHAVAPEDIMALLDNELSGEEAAAVQAHLATCPNCVRLADDLRRSSQQLSTWSVSTLPQPIEAAVLEAVSYSLQGEAVASSRSTKRWKRWTVGGLSTVAALLIFALTALHPAHHYNYQTPQVRTDSELSAPATASTAQNRTGAPEGFSGQAAMKVPPSTAQEAEDRFAGLASASTMPAPPPPVSVAKQAIMGGGGGPTRPRSSSHFQATPPMIARSVTLAIAVQNLDNTRSLLDAILSQHNGFAAQLNVASSEDSDRTLTASLRIPSTELASALVQLKALGKVRNETQSGEEVSEQHAGLAARLQNARATEARLRGILQQRTGSVSDVLEVEEQISSVREEIESMESDQKNLDHRVTYATVELQLTQEYKAPAAAAVPISTEVGNAFLAGVTNARDTLLGLLLFAEEYGPSILIWMVLLGVPVWVLLRRRYRRLRARV